MTFTVDVTGDGADANIGDSVCATSGGNCSLRAAIQNANHNPGPDSIVFGIAGGGVKVINLGNKLPLLSDAGTTIDGYTQSGAAVNTAERASNAKLRIEIRSQSTDVSWTALKIASSDNVIRGLAMYRNHRSIEIVGPSADRNVIAGNFIGTNAAGTFVSTEWNHANGGVYIGGGAEDNDIGLPNLADRNVISGNPASGVYFSGTGASFNRVRNNIVGLSPDGQRRLANRLEGIDINTGATDNVIGGTAQYEHNVVSGNFADGIEFSHGSSIQRNSAIGNYVGTNLAGTRGPDYARNGYRRAYGVGIMVEDGVRDTLVEDNVVGNAGYALIHISGKPVSQGGKGITRGTTVRGNRIGVSLDGSDIGVRQGGCCGIRIDLVTDTSTIEDNLIRNNPTGIGIFAAGDDRHTITRNRIWGNSGLGIDLQPVGGVTVNDFGDGDTGANQQRNYPALTSATPTTVTGSACAGCTVEVFLADGGANPANAYGEGRTFLAGGVAGPDRRFSIDVSGHGLAAGDFVTATATDGNGNTSEFSLDLRVRGGQPPAGTVLGADGFGRTVTGGWGRAGTGGFWSTSADRSDYRVGSGQGRIDLGKGQVRQAALLSVSSGDVVVRAKFRTDERASGGSQFVWLAARQVSLDDGYRLRVRLGTDHRVYLRAVRVVGGAETALGPEVKVASFQHQANGWFFVKGQVTGAASTVIRMKAWAAGSPEPSGWSYVHTDTSGALLLPGAVGVGASVATGSNAGPIRVSVDDLRATVAP
jgi:hypothetical protein